jgi:hypothetical protein
MRWRPDPELERLYRKHAQKGTPRYQRAHRFASQMLAALRAFVPSDYDVIEIVHMRLVYMAFEHNAEVINVPPEWDHLDRLAIEAVMLKTKVAQVETLVKEGA